MRKFVILGVIALVLFGISAGVSIWLSSTKKKAEGEGGGEGHAAASTSREGNLPPNPSRPAARPPYNPEAENAVQLAAKLREQEEGLRRRELQFSVRQKQLEIIQNDIRTERTSIDDLRKQLNDEMRAAADKIDQVEKRYQELEQKRRESTQQTQELKRTMLEYEGVEADRIKQMAGMYDSMPAENAAKIFQNLIDTGATDVAVKILANMKERQAARVLAEFRDPSVAAQLVDKLRSLKRPTSSTTPKK